MEMVGGLVILVGCLIFFIGWIWLIVIGFKQGGALWGILNILCQPITGIIFCFVHKTGWLPLALLIIGYVISFVGMIPLIPTYMRMLEQLK